jgi:hypothetical protein
VKILLQEAIKAAFSAAQASDAKMARLDMGGHHGGGLPPPPHSHASQFFSDPYAQVVCVS